MDLNKYLITDNLTTEYPTITRKRWHSEHDETNDRLFYSYEFESHFGSRRKILKQTAVCFKNSANRHTSTSSLDDRPDFLRYQPRWSALHTSFVYMNTFFSESLLLLYPNIHALLYWQFWFGYFHSKSILIFSFDRNGNRDRIQLPYSQCKQTIVYLVVSDH